MQKFTAFTVLLTVLTVVVVSDIVVNDYLPRKDQVIEDNMQFDLPDSLDLSNTLTTNVLGSDDVVVTGMEEEETEDPSEVVINLGEGNLEVANEELVEVANNLKDFESFSGSGSLARFSPNVYLRDEQIKSAGFVGAYLEDGDAEDKLYKSISLIDFEDSDVRQSIIRTDNEMLAKVTVVRPGTGSEVGDMYEIIKGRAAAGLNTEVNETNDFGQGSFYMNDASRQGTAFLTVRLGGLIYGFSYPKTYHSQVKNLLQLIEWEME